MQKYRFFRHKMFFITLLVDLMLLFSVLFLMKHVQNLLNLDVSINLTEIVTQNKDVITSKLQLEMNNLAMVAQQIGDRLPKSDEANADDVYENFLHYAQEKNEESIFYADLQGNAHFIDGAQINISGRRYFQLAIEGTRNISERSVSRKNGDDIFVISVPLSHLGKVIGTVQRQYTPAEMYELCSVSLFSEQGSTYIVNSQGYILISSQQDQYNRESDNYFRVLYASDPAAANRLQMDIQNQTPGFMETANGSEGKVFSAYTPIDQIYDWYLITSVSTSAVSPNARIVIQLFYCVLMAVVLFFACALVYFLYTKNKRQADLEQLAFVDTVTGGSTYTKFTVDLKQALAERAGREAFMFTFDIDNFKYINSNYGFEVGDRILRHIYTLYRQKLTPGELLARVTGDQFVALLYDASPERMQALFTAELQDKEVGIYLSAGLYAIANEEENPNLMLDKASIAAKKTKGKRFKVVTLYSEEMELQLARNEQLKRAMESALEAKEIMPFFQPKVDINTGKLVGAEALARWRTKEGLLISPGEFIPVCEQTGLIVAVDMTIFEQTLAFLRANLERGVACVPISVNFSRLHLFSRDFLDSLQSKLVQYQVPASLIELELTETVIFDNYQNMEQIVRDMHEAGLLVAMDDFGSGYSSLHMLKDIDIDVLKIDRGFLLETENSARQKIIFSAIVRMAQELDIKVVVEGVENEENVELMKASGACFAQGYYYAKPLEQEAFQKIYEDGAL